MNQDDDRPIRRPARFQISENTLFNAGMDRPTVEALRHLLTAVGNTPGTTLPDAVVDIEALSVAPALPEPLPFPDDLTPVQQVAQMVEQIYTETRQIAEHIAVLYSLINDLKQGNYP